MTRTGDCTAASHGRATHFGGFRTLLQEASCARQAREGVRLAVQLLQSRPGIRGLALTERRPADHQVTAAGFARLLGRLHADTDQAGTEFEALRRTLMRFFDWRGAWPPDECADETLDRLCRRLEEGAEVGDVRSYAYGIARLVLLERTRRPLLVELEDAPERAEWHPAAVAVSDDGLRDCFDTCLSHLNQDGRALLLEYYEGERRGRIDNRRRMAAAHGLSENALRSRVQRLRDRLESCVRTCLDRREREERL